jgi:site-specific DNA recombinase
MPSTNGHGPKRSVLWAILYARVSSAEQVEGYSLDQQIDALRAWASREGYEVLAEVRDEGWSAAYLERPGLDQVRDMVEEGGVSVVVAQDADRITREPAHRAFLDGECERYGTRLVALDDWGDDTHEGELLRFLKGWMAKGERIKTAERTRRGRVQKARQGEIVGSHPPRFGFRFVRNDKGKSVGYEVDENQMAVVRRVFRMVGEEGMTLYAVRKSLTAAGILSPSGKKLWHQGYLRTMILDDIYRPHTFEEVRELVSPAVAATLDPYSSYGVCYYDKRRQSRTAARKADKANGRYRYAYATSYRPRESWLAVPLPDSGIPRGWVDRAREAIKDNRRPPLRACASGSSRQACCAAPPAGGRCRLLPSPQAPAGCTITTAARDACAMGRTAATTRRTSAPITPSPSFGRRSLDSSRTRIALGSASPP